MKILRKQFSNIDWEKSKRGYRGCWRCWYIKLYNHCNEIKTEFRVQY